MDAEFLHHPAYVHVSTPKPKNLAAHCIKNFRDYKKKWFAKWIIRQKIGTEPDHTATSSIWNGKNHFTSNNPDIYDIWSTLQTSLTIIQPSWGCMKTGLEFNHASKHCRCFPSVSFCGKIVTEEQNLIVSHENNMLQLYYTQWSWNCRGCWHQSCLQLPLTKKLKFYLFQITRHGCTVLLFLTPPCVKINLGNLHACRLPVIYTQFF